MPPNLGGFFMVRSYYPSECHADYFDFERIEALKPAIEACGISTDPESGSAGMPRPISDAVVCLQKKLLCACIRLAPRRPKPWSRRRHTAGGRTAARCGLR